VIFGFVVTPLNHFLAASCTFFLQIATDLPLVPGGVPGREAGWQRKHRALPHSGVGYSLRFG